jgi:hypothetical protein
VFEVRILYFALDKNRFSYASFDVPDGVISLHIHLLLVSTDQDSVCLGGDSVARILDVGVLAELVGGYELDVRLPEILEVLFFPHVLEELIVAGYGLYHFVFDEFEHRRGCSVDALVLVA